MPPPPLAPPARGSAKVAKATISTRFTTASKVGAKVGEPTIQTAAVRTPPKLPSSAMVWRHGSPSLRSTAVGIPCAFAASVGKDAARRAPSAASSSAAAVTAAVAAGVERQGPPLRRLQQQQRKQQQHVSTRRRPKGLEEAVSS